MTNRFEAQQDMRLALDKLRREIHCANDVALSNGSVGTGFATATGQARDVLSYECRRCTCVTWCTTASTVGYDLLRYTGTAAVTNCAAPPAGVTERNRFRYLTTDKIFTGYSPPVAGSGNLGTLGVHLPVDVNPSDAKQRYVLKDDIVLRNTPRQ